MRVHQRSCDGCAGADTFNITAHLSREKTLCQKIGGCETWLFCLGQIRQFRVYGGYEAVTHRFPQFSFKQRCGLTHTHPTTGIPHPAGTGPSGPDCHNK